MKRVVEGFIKPWVLPFLGCTGADRDLILRTSRVPSTLPHPPKEEKNIAERQWKDYAGKNNPAYPRPGTKNRIHRNAIKELFEKDGRIVFPTLESIWLGCWPSQMGPIGDYFETHEKAAVITVEWERDEYNPRAVIVLGISHQSVMA